MPIYIGNTAINPSGISAVYVGNTKVWESSGPTPPVAPSYFYVYNGADVTYVSINSTYAPVNFQYSYDTTTWTNYTLEDVIRLTDSTGHNTVYFRGNNNSLASSDGTQYTWIDISSDMQYEDPDTQEIYDIPCGGNTVGGDITTLLSYNGNITNLSSYGPYTFAKLFSTSGIGTVNTLTMTPTTLQSHCYYEMFNGCGYLNSHPTLPATNLAESCYEQMFYGCGEYNSDGGTENIIVESLPATVLATNCYKEMFGGNTSASIQYDEDPSCGYTYTLTFGIAPSAASAYEMFNYLTPTTTAIYYQNPPEEPEDEPEPEPEDEPEEEEEPVDE